MDGSPLLYKSLHVKTLLPFCVYSGCIMLASQGIKAFRFAPLRLDVHRTSWFKSANVWYLKPN
jgi:hypothetical protein